MSNAQRMSTLPRGLSARFGKPSGPARNRIACFACAQFLILSPFVSFVRHHDYPLLALEMALCGALLVLLGGFIGLIMIAAGMPGRVAGLALLATALIDAQLDPDTTSYGQILAIAVGCLFAAWLLRQRIADVVIVALATLFVGALLSPRGSPVRRWEAPRALPTRASDLPVVLHIILDEHIGLDGIPPEVDPDRRIARQLQDFYRGYAFELHPRAYSHFYNSQNSIPNILNFSSLPDPDHYFGGHFHPAMQLTTNAYFEEMGRRGYRLHVYQSGYIDFCSEDGDFPIQRCTTFDAPSIAALRPLDLEAREKAALILGVYERRFHLLRAGKSVHAALYRFFSARGWWLPAPDLHPTLITSISPLPNLMQLQKDLADARPGDLFFAHFLLPHHPYVFTPDCRTRPFPWLGATAPEAAPQTNTAAQRAVSDATGPIWNRCSAPSACWTGSSRT